MKMTPETKRTAIIVIGAVIITSMITGYFPELVDAEAKAKDFFFSFFTGSKA